MFKINEKKVKILIVVYLLEFLVLVCFRFYSFLNQNIFDRDWYVYHYKDFLTKGFYVKVSEGTSVLFNLYVQLWNTVFSDINFLFLAVNISSIIVISFLAYKIIKLFKCNTWYSFVFLMIYMAFWFENIQITWSNNDIFFTMLSMLLLYVMLCNINMRYKIIFIGVLLACLISTRAFTAILIPGIIVYLFLNRELFFEVNYTYKIGAFVLFVSTLFVFHYPALIENQKLSFYDKASEKYMLLNTLGMIDVFETNNINWTRKNIHNGGWSIDKINEVKLKYNVVSIPENVIESMLRYPVYHLKMFMLNVYYVLLYLFRRYSFLMILPFYFFFKSLIKNKGKDLSSKYYMPILLFVVTLLTLLCLLNCPIEYRWFDSFEFLFVLSILIGVDRLLYEQKSRKLTYNIMFLSFLLFIVFNTRSLLNML